jgi:hypothetical protein
VIITYPEVLTSHQMSGTERAVSCLTASRCVAVGSRRYHGAVVTLTNGIQSHAAVLRSSSVLDTVSCRKSECWAIGRPDRGAGVYLVKISSAGRPVAEWTLAVPTGTTLGAISCASPTSCEVAGTDNHVRPAAIEIGTWNGTRLRLYRVRGVKGAVALSMPGISCWHSDCEAVGSALVGSAAKVHGLILTTSHGKPGTLQHANGYGLDSVSCVSATTCYAAASNALVTVTRGVATNPQALPGPYGPGWNGIECQGANCEAAGGQEIGSAAVGVLVNLTGGTAGPPVIVHDTGGFSGIATRAGSGFIATGAGSNSGTDITIG